MSEIAINLRAHDRASAVIDHVSKKMGIFSKQGIGMGIAFAGVSMGMGMAMQGIQSLIQGMDEGFQKARQYERGMGEISTMLDAMGKQYLPSMREGINELATTMGLSTADLQRGMYQTLSASVDAAEAMDFLGQAGKAAVAGLTSVETAVDALTTVLNAYGMSTHEVSIVSDLMFQTVKRGKTTFEELAESIGYVVPIAAQANIAFEEIAAAFATLTKQGINASTSATSLRALLSNLISPSKEATDAAQKYGIVLNDISLEVLGLSGIMAKLNEVTDGSVGKMRELIPNIRALQAASGLAANDLETFTFDLNAMQSAIGSTDSAFGDMANTMDTKFRILEQRFELLQRQLGMEPAMIAAKKTIMEWGAAWEREQAGVIRGFQGLANEIMNLATIPFDLGAWGRIGKGWAAAMEEDIDDILDEMEAAVSQETITLNLDQLLNIEGVDAMASKLSSMWGAGEVDANTVIAYMNQWGREIERTTQLIDRITTEIEQLDLEIGDLNLQLQNYDDLKRYQEALYYIPIAMEDAAFTTKIFDAETQALVDSIRIQRQEIDKLDRKTKEYSMSMRENSIEALQIELRAMGRRGRLTRAEQKRLDDLKKEDLEYRIATLQNQQAIDKIKYSGLYDDEQRLAEKQRLYQEEIKIIRDAQDTTRRDMENDLNAKKALRDAYEKEYLPKVREEALAALDKYNAGLILIEGKWSDANIKIWEDMAGDIEFQRNRIMAFKADITGGDSVEMPSAKSYAISNFFKELLESPSIQKIWPQSLIDRLYNRFVLGEYPIGTSRVPKSGLYHLDEGEAVIPAYRANQGKAVIIKIDPITVNAILTRKMDVNELGNELGKAIAAGTISGLESEWEIG